MTAALMVSDDDLELREEDNKPNWTSEHVMYDL